MDKQERMPACRVILFPHPFVGHLTPMLYLGNALHSKGFSITIIHTHFNAPDPAKYPDFIFHYIEDGQSKAQVPPSDPFKALISLNASCSAPFRNCLSQLLAKASEDRELIACLILDPMWLFAAVIADEFNLPRIALRTGGMVALILYDMLPLLHEKGYFPIQEARKDDSVLEVPPLKVKDLPPQAHYEALVALAKEIKDCPDGIICNTFEELEGSALDQVHQNFLSIPVFPVGPLHKYASNLACNGVAEDQHYISWLNKQAPDSVLYVSFGTLAAISKEQFLEVAWGLAKCEQPFLWVVRPKSVNGSDESYPFPEDFLEAVTGRGLIVPWALQHQVLANPAVGGFWTHCGWNSTLESISEGVPMICSPFWADQMPNARQLSDVLKIGLQLEKGLERQEIEKTVRRLMVEKEGEEMRKRAGALKEKAQQCIREGGSSYESLNRLTSHILSLAKLKE